MTQQGTLKFSVSYNALDSATGTSIRVAIGTATYRYSISYVPGYVAKEGSDLFFNYCLKQHPEKIVQSGGVLMCTTDSEIKYSLHRVWGK